MYQLFKLPWRGFEPHGEHFFSSFTAKKTFLGFLALGSSLGVHPIFSYFFNVLLACLLFFLLHIPAQCKHVIIYLCILYWILLAVCRTAGAAAAAVAVEFIRT